VPADIDDAETTASKSAEEALCAAGYPSDCAAFGAMNVRNVRDYATFAGQSCGAFPKSRHVIMKLPFRRLSPFINPDDVPLPACTSPVPSRMVIIYGAKDIRGFVAAL